MSTAISRLSTYSSYDSRNPFTDFKGKTKMTLQALAVTSNPTTNLALAELMTEYRDTGTVTVTTAYNFIAYLSQDIEGMKNMLPVMQKLAELSIIDVLVAAGKLLSDPGLVFDDGGKIPPQVLAITYYTIADLMANPGKLTTPQ